MHEKNIRYKILIPLMAFFLISVICIYSASKNFDSNEIIIKQIIWYILGFLIIIITTNKKLKRINNISFYLYIFGNILLLLLLIFGKEVNGFKMLVCYS